jgi:hypothetical protein
MYLRLTPNLLHFLPELGALYTVRPTFMKSTPGLVGNILVQNQKKSSQHSLFALFF